MSIAIAYAALQGIFGFFVVRMEEELLSLQFTSLMISYWVTLITSSVLYFSLTLINPGFVIQDPEVVESLTFNSTSEALPPMQDVLKPNVQISSQTHPEENTNEDKTDNEATTQPDNVTVSGATLRSLKSTSPIFKQQTEIAFKLEKRYCRHCHLDQPHRTKHCYDCEKCVATYDHHCPWVNNCIGENNRALFYLFTVSQNLQISISMYITLTHLPYNLIECAILLSFQLILFVMMTTLMGFHSILMVFGCTTWEYLKWSSINYLEGYKRPFGPFYEGVCKNILKFWMFFFKSRRANYEWVVIDNGRRKEVKD